MNPVCYDILFVFNHANTIRTNVGSLLNTRSHFEALLSHGLLSDKLFGTIKHDLNRKYPDCQHASFLQQRLWVVAYNDGFSVLSSSCSSYPITDSSLGGKDWGSAANERIDHVSSSLVRLRVSSSATQHPTRYLLESLRDLAVFTVPHTLCCHSLTKES